MATMAMIMTTTAATRAAAPAASAHGPDPAALAQANGLARLRLLVGAVAIRPLYGFALFFVLILTAQMGIFRDRGVGGTFAMALGTASVTIAVAVAAVDAAAGALAGLPTTRCWRWCSR